MQDLLKGSGNPDLNMALCQSNAIEIIRITLAIVIMLIMIDNNYHDDDNMNNDDINNG